MDILYIENGKRKTLWIYCISRMENEKHYKYTVYRECKTKDIRSAGWGEACPPGCTASDFCGPPFFV